MLETDDVDDDYFTPVSNTPLSNIFGASSSKESKSDSLKYTPPKKPSPQASFNLKSEDTKVTECLFACALMAYEWLDNNYIPRGKLGLAIVKNIKANNHNLILYNSNKITLSNATITTALNVTVKGKNYISYYDNYSKYWSVYAKDEEISKLSETLQHLGVDVKCVTSTDKNPPEPTITEQESKPVSTTINSDKESDTDSSANKKTKASILSRMANMGHSVLPPQKNVLKEISSYSDDHTASEVSSDTDEKVNKTSRSLKPKIMTKRTSIEKIKSQTSVIKESMFNTNVAKIEPPSESLIYTYLNEQLVPVANTSIISGHSSNHTNNEMNLFMTEQRMSNNEIRININRAIDKIDQTLEKIKNLEDSEKRNNNDFQMQIMNKLISEYENKIKLYEKCIDKDKLHKLLSNSPVCLDTDEPKHLKDKISALESANQEKDKEIAILNGKLQSDHLLKDIIGLKLNLSEKIQELDNIVKKLDESASGTRDTSSDKHKEKLKLVMNDVYKIVTANFQNDETYSGDHIKSVIASVIKNVTVQSLSQNRDNY